VHHPELLPVPIGDLDLQRGRTAVERRAPSTHLAVERLRRQHGVGEVDRGTEVGHDATTSR
jgi:hypothetical protein